MDCRARRKRLDGTIQAAVTLPDPCGIKFLSQGALNKIFTITSADKQVVARVTLPIDPKWKTLSEVATLEWVQTNTSLPVPKVFAYDAYGSTPIGFEWIAMEMMPGKPWADAYRSMTFSAKEEVVRRIARFNSEVFKKPMRGIGNIFPGETKVERIVSSAFICHGFGRENVQRGPFSSTWQWLQSRLDLAELDCRGRLEKAKASMTQDTDGSHGGTDSQETQNDHNKKDQGAEKMEDQDASDNDEAEDDEDDLDVLENALKIIDKLKVHYLKFSHLQQRNRSRQYCSTMTLTDTTFSSTTKQGNWRLWWIGNVFLLCRCGRPAGTRLSLMENRTT